MIHGNIKEALNLPGMQIHGQHAVRASRHDQISDELGRDRHARLGFAILPRITVIRHNQRNAAGRCASQRVHHNEHLH